MSAMFSVMYPNTPGPKFDVDYYLGAHAKLVGDRCRDRGLVGVTIQKGVATPDPDTPAPYQVIAQVEFETMEAMQAALADTAEEIMGDIPNFTDATPVVRISEKLGR